MLNVAILQGRLVADPELRYTPNNIAVTSFTIAVDRSYVKSGTERQADFIDIVAWRSTAEFICKYFHKGQMIAIQGSIQTRSYTDSQGIKRKAFEIVADNVHFSDSKRDNTGNNNYSQHNDYSTNSAPAAPAYSNGDTGDFEEIISDDDLPF